MTISDIGVGYAAILSTATAVIGSAPGGGTYGRCVVLVWLVGALGEPTTSRSASTTIHSRGRSICSRSADVATTAPGLVGCSECVGCRQGWERRLARSRGGRATEVPRRPTSSWVTERPRWPHLRGPTEACPHRATRCSDAATHRLPQDSSSDRNPAVVLAKDSNVLREVPRNTATGIRTPVSAVRGRRPSPLDDSGARDALTVAKGSGTPSLESSRWLGRRRCLNARPSRGRMRGGTGADQGR
jgi:hypothetical protein